MSLLASRCTNKQLVGWFATGPPAFKRQPLLFGFKHSSTQTRDSADTSTIFSHRGTHILCRVVRIAASNPIRVGRLPSSWPAAHQTGHIQHFTQGIVFLVSARQVPAFRQSRALRGAGSHGGRTEEA
jgi:hypothetical protein